MSENEIPNYFVLNKYSELWETKSSFGDKDYVSLTPTSSFVLSSTMDIPPRLHLFDNDSTRVKPTPIDPNSFSLDLDLDRYNMLYILEKDKDTKKIRRLSVDRYEQYGTTNTENLIFDEYIISCKGLTNPQSIAATDRHIYVLDNSTLYVLSKINYNLIRTLKFHNRINVFKLTEDEGILFYSYVDEKGVVYRKNLIQGFETSEGDREEDQRIKITQNSTSSYTAYTDNEDSESIIDIAVNNIKKTVYVLTHKYLYSYYFELTKPFADPVRLGDNTKDDFSPTSLAIDQESNDIFVGNTTGKDVRAFPRKLTFGKELEKIGVECQSQWIFFSKAMTSYPRLLIFNIVSDRNSNENKDANYDDKIGDRTTRKEDSLENTRIQTNVSNISCKILDEYPFYDTKSRTILTTQLLDSLNEKTRWYKIAIDQDIPPYTIVKLAYFCSDHENSHDGRWITAPVNSNNILILGCVGRYLKIRVELSTSDEQKSPRFNKMTIYFSVPTYLRYLPEIYQENEQSKIFLERFLCIFQTLFAQTESKISSFIRHLDVGATPDEFLPWLSSWLSLSFNEGWSSQNTRSFLESAPDIFRKRGTREGLEEILSIYLQCSVAGKDYDDRLQRCGNYFLILDGKKELDELSEKIDDPAIKDLIENISPDFWPYYFYVFLNPSLIDRIKAKEIERIIEREKPAHTVGVVRFLQEGSFPRSSSQLRSDTITRDRNNFILGKSYTSIDTVQSSAKEKFGAEVT